MKRRLLSLLLCICMLMSTGLLLASCNKDDVGKTEGVSLDGYRVVYGQEAMASTVTYFTDFAGNLKRSIEGSISVKKVSATATLSDAEDREILIGNTNRPETKTALEKIEGHGYIIDKIGEKIVLVGTTNIFTTLALDRFTKEFLGGDEKLKTIDFKTIKESNLGTVEISESHNFVYSAELDGSKDYINKQIVALKSSIKTFSSVLSGSMNVIKDSNVASNEILVGLVERRETNEFIKEMDINSYGVGVQNAKIMVTALNDRMMEKAFSLFSEIMQDSVVVKGNKKNIILPADLSRIYHDTKNTQFLTDFPRPDSLTLTGSIDVSEDQMEYYYTGVSISSSVYEKYCEKLVAAGYKLLSDNKAESSIFRVYKNEAANAILFVSYNAFKHATTQAVTLYEPCLRIVSARLSSGVHLPEELRKQDLAYTKPATPFTSITAVKLNSQYQASGHNIYGNNYVVTLEDGSFIVYDGGQSYEMNVPRLYQVLLDLYQRTHGGANPTAEDPIRISAWLISHGHGDHYKIMRDFITQYAAYYGTYYITIDRLIANFTSDEEDDNSGNPDNAMRDNWETYSEQIKDAPGEEAGFEFIKVHTGERFYIANAEFEVVYTHEDLYPNRLHIYNDSSTVFRMTLYHTENGKISAASETSMLWLGDAQLDASKWMRSTYGSYLKSDMVQVAHHNYQGCEWELYQLVAPECVWWPVNRARWTSTTHNSGSTGYNLCCYNINYKLTSVKYIILSDDFNYTLTITKNGPDYALRSSSQTGVFSAGEAGAAVTQQSGVIKKSPTSYIKK